MTTEEKKEVPSRKNRLISFITILFLAAGLYAFYKGVDEQRKTRQQWASVEHMLQHIKVKEAQIATQFVVMRQLQERDQETLAALKATATPRQHADDWVLLEARYLLTLAKLNTLWTDNLKATRSLLIEASQLLESIHSNELTTVKHLIQEEIAHLDATPLVDKMDILTQLENTEKLTHSLLTQLPKEEPQKEINPPASRWQESVSLLKKLVVVKHVDPKDAAVLMTPLYASILRERIVLLLQEAQLAVIEGNESLYRLTLQQALNALEAQAHATELVQQIQHLLKYSLVQEKPEIGQSLSSLNQLIDSTSKKQKESRS